MSNKTKVIIIGVMICSPIGIAAFAFNSVVLSFVTGTLSGMFLTLMTLAGQAEKKIDRMFFFECPKDKRLGQYLDDFLHWSGRKHGYPVGQRIDLSHIQDKEFNKLVEEYHGKNKYIIS